MGQFEELKTKYPSGFEHAVQKAEGSSGERLPGTFLSYLRNRSVKNWYHP
jgi:hypothetical protein